MNVRCRVIGTVCSAIAALLVSCAPSVLKPDGRVLIIGTDNTYPYHYLNVQGQPEGMAAEIVGEAARRAGIRLVWKLRREGPSKAFEKKSVDLWPLLSDNALYKTKFHATAPYLTNSYVALFLDSTLAKAEGMKRVRRVSLVGYPLATRLTRSAFPGAAMVPTPERRHS